MKDNNIKRKIKNGIFCLVVIMVCLLLFTWNRNAWSEKPINTNRESIDNIVIRRGNNVLSVSQEKFETFLDIINKMRLKKRKINSDGVGGALDVAPGSEYIITINYKNGASTQFTIITKAECIAIHNEENGYYYYKNYDEEAMDELVKSEQD